MKLQRLVLFGVIGLCLGYGLFLLDNSGVRQRWQQIANPSNEVQDLFALEELPESADGVEFIKPCEKSSPELLTLWKSPKTNTDCVQRIIREADTYARSTFVMDKDGNIWMWQHSWYAYREESRKVFFPMSGSIIGIVVALIANKRRKTL
jgi:hypothetical protein